MKENAPPQKKNKTTYEKLKKIKSLFVVLILTQVNQWIVWLKIRILASGKLRTNSFIIF